MAVFIFCAPVAVQAESPFGKLEVDVTSDYSHIRLRRQNNILTMLFVRDSGEEVVESSVDLDQPHRQLVPYTSVMFTSYLHQPKPDQILVVGLGGGAMVHFLEKYDPDACIDVVEIDPVVSEIAAEHFGVGNAQNTNITIADGVDYIRSADTTYDVIYMDAFLKPSVDTDETGVPLNLKTRKFYQQLQSKLSLHGVVVFNLNQQDQAGRDLRIIKSSFPQVYVYRVAKSTNLVVVASRSPQRLPRATAVDRARQLDVQMQAGYSFEAMARMLVR
ncbi:MAG: fused MFS/spermidine synthase [Planctomycetales bacterium]